MRLQRENTVATLRQCGIYDSTVYTILKLVAKVMASACTARTTFGTKDADDEINACMPYV